MNAGKPTKLETLIPLLRTQIATGTGIAVDYVIPTLSEEWFDPGALGGLSDRYVVISNFAGNEYGSLTDGGGTAQKVWNATCDVTMVARLDTDVAGYDINRLVDTTYGLLPVWRLMLKALDQWFPNDGGTPAWGLLLQPARTFGFLIKPRRYQSTNGWVQMRTKLHFPFVQDLS